MLLLTGASASLPQIPMPWQFALVITTPSHLTFFVFSRTKGNSWHCRQLIGEAGRSLKQRAPGCSKTALVPIPFASARAWGSSAAWWWWWWWGARGQCPWGSSYCWWWEIEGHPLRSRSLFPSSLLPSVTAAATAPSSGRTPSPLLQQTPGLGMFLLCSKPSVFCGC